MSFPDYTDVEHMIFRGFLSEPSEIAGVPFVFKTINQTEYELSLMHSYASDPEEEERLQECYFIAHSIYLFNRTTVLQDRQAFFSEFIDIVYEWPAQVRYKILASLQKLNARALDAMSKVEGFSYGMDSRQRWSLLHRLSPNDPRVTGIPGTDLLGLNMHQRLWFHYNTLDDKQERFDLDWSRTKFLASVHSKEISKIDSQDKSKKREERMRRESIFQGFDPSQGVGGPDGEVKFSLESVDDLLGQLKRDIEGQKDFHDMVVDEHERLVREKFMRLREQQAQQAQLARQYRNQRMQTEMNEPVVFYDEDTVSRITKQRKAEKRKALMDGRFAQEQEQVTQMERLKKWGILEEEDVREPAVSAHPLYNTVMNDYYEVQLPDLSKKSPFDPNPEE